nr:transcription factor SRM1 [Tanacetum cinerariifolium]
MVEETKESVWTREQDVAFEEAIVTYADEDDEERWEKIAAEVPGEKSVEEIKNHYELLVEDVERIESGVVPLPVYSSSMDDSESHAGEGGTGKKRGQNGSVSNHGKASKSEQERRKGIAWSEEEHRNSWRTNTNRTVGLLEKTSSAILTDCVGNHIHYC